MSGHVCILCHALQPTLTLARCAAGKLSLVEEPACLPQAAVPGGRVRVRPNSASVGKSNQAAAGARALGIADMDQAWTTT